MPATWHLGQLHLVIQAAFNWWNYHLHEYRIGGLRYGEPEAEDWGSEDSPKLFDEAEVRLCDFGYEPGMTFTYVYDFGDDWHHAVEIERHLALEPLPTVATCIDGARARPPEDVGGPSGYERFLAVLADPGDAEHADTRRWSGGHFDPAWFDLVMARQGCPQGVATECSAAAVPTQAAAAQATAVTIPMSVSAMLVPDPIQSYSRTLGACPGND